jgi:hypothetical protein
MKRLVCVLCLAGCPRSEEEDPICGEFDWSVEGDGWMWTCANSDGGHEEDVCIDKSMSIELPWLVEAVCDELIAPSAAYPEQWFGAKTDCPVGCVVPEEIEELVDNLEPPDDAPARRGARVPAGLRRLAARGLGAVPTGQ